MRRALGVYSPVKFPQVPGNMHVWHSVHSPWKLGWQCHCIRDSILITSIYLFTHHAKLPHLLTLKRYWLPYIGGIAFTHPFADSAFGDFSVTIVLGIAITYGVEKSGAMGDIIQFLTKRTPSGRSDLESGLSRA